LAGIASVISTYPLDIARTRLSISDNDPSHPRRTMLSVIRHIYRTERGWHGLYRGLSPTLLVSDIVLDLY
jgi:solute carrier family 25 phosphate transporter 23/24/25/41